MSDIEWTDEDDEPEWKTCVPVSCPDEEVEWVTFTAHPIINDGNRHHLFSEPLLPLRTLLGVPEGEQGVRLPAQDED